MASVAQSLPQIFAPLTWLREFLKQELKPYPSRAATVGRMVIAATLVMVLGMTFRIPYIFQGTVYTLLITRESPRATLRSSVTILFFTLLSAAYVLITVGFVISSPVLHFLWVVVTFFIGFYVLTTTNNYGVASTFAVVVSIAVPLWDRHVPAETNVEDTLWLTLSTCLGIVATAAIELIFVRFRPGDEIVAPIVVRLAAVESLLSCYAENRPVDEEVKKKLLGLGIRGTSRLRRTLHRSDYPPGYRAQMNSVAAAVGRLVDLAATLAELSPRPSARDQQRLRNLVSGLENLRADLVNRRVPRPIQFAAADGQPEMPLLCEMEDTARLIPQAFAGTDSIDADLLRAQSDDLLGSNLLSADAFTNPDHLKFALRGCGAASACYIFYNSVDWPGISTAVTTCLLTALSTIGSSRQKQFLRFTGAAVGGFVLGMGSQIFILPYIDSIVGFTVLFVVVTAIGSWFMTSSPRLSYFGLQLLVAYYLINLQEFAFQPSLAVARDRVVGILIGLFAMWLLFDQFWGDSAASEMRKKFTSTLRLLAQLSREPISKNLQEATERCYSLRETISDNFDETRALGDGVIFEFGPSRQSDLDSRARILRWQPQLRTLFLTRNILWRYRVELPGFEIPPPVASAQQQFDEHLAIALEGMADRIEGSSRGVTPALEPAFENVEQTIRAYDSTASPESHARLEAFLSLSERVEALTVSLAREI